MKDVVEGSFLSIGDFRGEGEKLGDVSKDRGRPGVVADGRKLISHMGGGNLLGTSAPLGNGEGPIVGNRFGA